MSLHNIRQYWQSCIWFCCILYASFAPKQNLDNRFLLFEHQDKVIHAIMYGVLILLVLLNSKKRYTLSRQSIVIIFICVIALSLSIEFLQPILSNRTFDISDFYANSIGAVIGIIFFTIKNKSLSD